MKKIAILVYDVTLVGGAERVALNMAEALAEHYQVHLISLFHEKKENVPMGKPYCAVALREQTCSITKRFFSISKDLRNYLKEHHIQVLYSITAGVVSLAAHAARGGCAKMVYCEHSNLENKTYGKKHELRQYVGAKFSDKVVTLTERDRKNFMQAYRLSAERVQVIPNWFTAHKENDQPYDRNTCRIISAGRLESVKGPDLLLEVARRVAEKSDLDQNWHWDVYGDGSMREELQEKIEEWKLGDFLSLKGNVNNLHELYPQYAFFVMTSYHEGLPMVLLEAQAAKLPIISFDIATGPAEIVAAGENGFIIPPYDLDAMADKVLELMKNPELRMAFSNRSGIGIHRYDKERLLEKWIRLTEELSE